MKRTLCETIRTRWRVGTGGYVPLPRGRLTMRILLLATLFSIGVALCQTRTLTPRIHAVQALGLVSASESYLLTTRCDA
jgi:hypothetical protein